MPNVVTPLRFASPPAGASTNGHGREIAALLAAARAVPGKRAFPDAARAILRACRTSLGARSGLVAFRSAGSEDFEVALRDPPDSGPLGAAGLSPPLCRLASRSFRSRRAVVSNSSATPKSPAGRPLSGRRPAPGGALLAPVVIGGRVEGFVGLVDRPGGFSPADGRLAEVFAAMVAAARLDRRTVDGLETDRTDLQREADENASHLRRAEETFRTLVENLPDVVARFDPDLRHLYVSPAVERVTGRSSKDFVGKTNRELGVSPDIVERWDDALRKVFATGQPERLEFTLEAPDATRRFDCRLVPEPGPGGSIPSVLSVARDVTDRWLANEAEKRARGIAEALREATVVLTRSLDRETVLANLLDRLRPLVPFDRARVMLLEGSSRISIRAVFDGNRVVPLPPTERPELEMADHPVLHGVLSSGTALLIPDVRTHPGWSLTTDPATEASWMGVPLFVRGAVAGLFSLSKSEVDYFNEEHVRLAEAMSSQASVAVENAVLFEQMTASATRMKSLSRRLVDVQETERRRVSRELHDEAGQALASLRYGLRLLERDAEAGGSVTERVAELMQRTDAVIDGLHRLAADLRPASLDHLGLEAALRQYTRSAESRFGLSIRFKARGFTEERLPTEVETALYRVVQEAITNVVRHARATRVDVLAERRDGRVLVMVEDDGVGFEPAQVPRGSDFGLLGLRERAEALGGTLTIESAPGAGTTVVVEVASADPHPDC